MDLAQRFRALHLQSPLLLLPNIWDVAGARLLEELGYPAVATASAAVARSLGYEDGENVPFEQVCWLLARITASVTVPVTADIEAGYARDPQGLRQNIHRLLDTGIVGINIEDTDPRTDALLPIGDQAARIRVIRETAAAKGIALFINARTDTYFRLQTGQREEALRRAHAYLDAGADGIYPIGAKTMEDIRALVTGIPAPVNILAQPGVLDLRELEAAGVARVSMGPKFQTSVLEKMKELATALQGSAFF